MWPFIRTRSLFSSQSFIRCSHQNFQVVGSFYKLQQQKTIIRHIFNPDKYYSTSSNNLPNVTTIVNPPAIVNSASNGSNPLDMSKILKPIQPDLSYISCTVFDANGDVIAVSKKFPKTTFLNENRLFPRDLRKIDSSNVDVAPIMGVRPNSILINLLHVKALIRSNSVLIFDTSNSESASKLSLFMYDLESKLKTKIVHGTTSILNQSYEFRALECVLINVMAVLETELQQNLKVCTSILSDLDIEIDRGKLRDLLVHSKKLTTFYQKALLIKNVLDELLDNDDDLESMYLTAHHQLSKEENLQNAKKPDGLNEDEELDTAEVEMLIESYYKQCDEIVQQAETLINDIKSTEEIVNIILDANRNSLMVYELKISIYTLGFTVATLIPAFYGMNLKNYIEEDRLAFGVVVGFSCLCGMAMVIYAFRKLKCVQKMTTISSNQMNQFNTKMKDRVIKDIKKDIGGGASETEPSDSGFYSRLKRKKRGAWRHSKDQKDMIWKWLVDEKHHN